jgi:hypothetical protein
MELFCAYADMALSANPQLRKKDAESIKRRVLVVSKQDLIASKQAAGQKVDLEDVRLLEQTIDQDDIP